MKHERKCEDCGTRFTVAPQFNGPREFKCEGCRTPKRDKPKLSRKDWLIRSIMGMRPL